MEELRCSGCMQIKSQNAVCEHCGYRDGASNLPHQLPTGTILQDRYLVGKVLGQGGFGITYIGYDQYLDTPVAIKEYYPNGVVIRDCTHSLAVTAIEGEYSKFYAENRQRFFREAKALARFSQVPSIVHIQNLFLENNTAYIVMEYLRGITLKQHIASRGGRLSAKETFRLLLPIMKALNTVHKEGIIHRDISPDNIMLMPDGSTKLLDFGAVREVHNADADKPLTKSTEAILKHGFAPIEQYQTKGGLGPWTDVYALCATIYYCLTGTVPGDAPLRVMGEAQVDWQTVPGLTEQQRTALSRGMAIAPKQRTASVGALYRELFGDPATQPKDIPMQYPSGTVALGQQEAYTASVSDNLRTVSNTSYTAPVTAPVNTEAYTAPVSAEPPGRQSRSLPKWLIPAVCGFLAVIAFAAGFSRVSGNRAQLQEESAFLLEKAALLAAGYDYDGAISALDSFSGDLQDYPDMVAARTDYENAKDSLIAHSDPSAIANLSFHMLIEDPARAYMNKDYGGLYNRNYVTTAEFQSLLEQLYRNGYVLVNFENFVASGAGYSVVPIMLPAGKKPIMLTQTNVNYYSYMVDGKEDAPAETYAETWPEPNPENPYGHGFARRLVVDEKGSIQAEYTDGNGVTHLGSFDFVPILEDFIQAHPDFSYRGARATLAVTGYEGIFGWRCNTSYIDTQGQAFYDEQVEGAKNLVSALRSKGYRIACYSYANKDYNALSTTQIQEELTLWHKQITPILGQVDTFVFARESDIDDYSGKKFDILYANGFRYLVASGEQPYAQVNSTYVRQTRLMVTGNSLAHSAEQFAGIIDPDTVLDMVSRKSIPN